MLRGNISPPIATNPNRRVSDQAAREAQAKSIKPRGLPVIAFAVAAVILSGPEFQLRHEMRRARRNNRIAHKYNLLIIAARRAM